MKMQTSGGIDRINPTMMRMEMLELWTWPAMKCDAPDPRCSSCYFLVVPSAETWGLAEVLAKGRKGKLRLGLRRLKAALDFDPCLIVNQRTR